MGVVAVGGISRRGRLSQKAERGVWADSLQSSHALVLLGRTPALWIYHLRASSAAFSTLGADIWVMGDTEVFYHEGLSSVILSVQSFRIPTRSICRSPCTGQAIQQTTYAAGHIEPQGALIIRIHLCRQNAHPN